MNAVISVQGLEVHFPGCDALRGIDLQVSPGTVFALLGENGAGKTTLIRILTGFLRGSRGQCRVLGLDPVKEAQAIRKRIGYVSDAPALYDWMRVDEIGWFAAAFYADGFLDRYRESISEVTINMEDPLAALPQLESPAELLYEKSEGRQRRWVVKDFTSEMREQLGVGAQWQADWEQQAKSLAQPV